MSDEEIDEELLEQEVLLDEEQEQQIQEATGTQDVLAGDESDDYTWREHDPSDLDEDDPTCDECDSDLLDDGACPNPRCSVNPCPACREVGEACQCPPRSDAEWGDFYDRQNRQQLGKAISAAATDKMMPERPASPFGSTRAFDQHLTEKRQTRSSDERRRKSAEQYDRPVKKYGS